MAKLLSILCDTEIGGYLMSTKLTFSHMTTPLLIECKGECQLKVKTIGLKIFMSTGH